MLRQGIFMIMGVLFLGGPALAVDRAVKCEADKLKETGKYGFCLLKAESKGLKKGEAPDVAKCVGKFTGKWPDIEAKAGGACPTNGDQATMDSEISSHADRMAVLLSGGEPASTLPATGQTTCWESSGSVVPCAGTGHDGEVQAGAALSYLDNGDGTISDLNTGLMWEKQSADGTIHDWDNVYDWDDAFAVHVAGLNSAVFVGHTDWRLPNAKELHSIIDYERSNPSVDPVFDTACAPACMVTTCSCTASSVYWSATSDAFFPFNAWFVSFFRGNVSNIDKSNNFSVRAVRGGL